MHTQDGGSRKKQRKAAAKGGAKAAKGGADLATEETTPKTKEELAEEEMVKALKDANKLKQVFAKAKFQAEALIQVVNSAEAGSPYLWAKGDAIIGKLTATTKDLETNTNSFARMFLCSDNKTCKLRSGSAFMADLTSFNSLQCKVAAVMSEHAQITRMHNSRGAKDSPSK